MEKRSCFGRFLSEKKSVTASYCLVWRGSSVIGYCFEITKTADILVIIGTSMQVYPAASLMHYVTRGTPTYFIDPKPALESKPNLTVIAEPATTGVKRFIELINLNL